MQAALQTDRNEPVIDVQAIPPVQRHPLIFQAVQALAPGAAFSLVNDHDPRPLHLQLKTLFGDAFTWEYLEQGPQVWRVRIAKPQRTVANTNAYRIRIERNGRVLAADETDRLGPGENGALICDVTDCPPEATLATVLDLMHGVVPPAGEVSIAYERLVSRRSGSCCGGMCG